MKRHEHGLIDMTPLLDVVFILLFALILNVSITRAQDREDTEATIESFESRLTTSQESLTEAEAVIKEMAKELETQTMEKDGIDATLSINKEALDQAEEVAREKTAIIKAYSQSLSDTLDREIELSEVEVPIEWQTDPLDKERMVEVWLKYQQIGERYLFVDLSLSQIDGRIYLEDVYTGVNIEPADLSDREQARLLKEQLQFFILDWLDHKEGGYTFVFVSVVADVEVKRAVVETVFDSLQGLQTSFDKDRYLINRFITYEQ